VLLGVGADAIAERREVLAETARGLAGAEGAGQAKAAEEREKHFHRGKLWRSGGRAVEPGSTAGAGERVADGGHVFADTTDGVAGGEEGDGEGGGDEKEQGFHGNMERGGRPRRAMFSVQFSVERSDGARLRFGGLKLKIQNSPGRD